MTDKEIRLELLKIAEKHMNYIPGGVKTVEMLMLEAQKLEEWIWGEVVYKLDSANNINKIPTKPCA